MLLGRVLLVLALVLLSCKKETREGTGSGSAPTAAALSAMTEDEVIDAALKSMSDIAALAKKHAADCETLAKALADHAAKHKDLITAFKKLSADEAKQREIAERHGGRILKIGQETVTALQAHCATHPAVKQLFETLN
jgi:acyl-CoA synthetase (NDP forming)